MYPVTQPRAFVLTVERMRSKFDEEAAHLTSLGITFEPFLGFDNSLLRLNPEDTFDIDRKGDRIGHKQVCACLSHYLLWKVMLYCPGDAFWGLEYDAQFKPDWKDQYAAAMAVLPDDWDIVFLGSCCCKGLKGRHVGNNLYEVHHPLCGHAIMYRKKALPVLLDVHQKVWGPLDIAMKETSLKQLRVYTLLPRMVLQRSTPIPA